MRLPRVPARVAMKAHARSPASCAIPCTTARHDPAPCAIPCTCMLSREGVRRAQLFA